MHIIGRYDKADFPLLQLKNLDVKVDTGAYTSSIHCHHIALVEKEGRQFVHFELLDPMHPKYHDKVFEIAEFSSKTVKNSFGESQERYVIQTQIILFGEKHPIDLSLAERGEMRFPVLLGRKFLTGRYLVDTSKFKLSYRQKQKLLRKNRERS